MRNTSIVSMKPTSGATDKRVTVSSTAITLNGNGSAPTFNAKTKFVYIDFQAQPIAVTFDGSDPTTTNGHFYTAGDDAVWSKAQAVAARFIRQTGTDGTIHASEFTE